MASHKHAVSNSSEHHRKRPPLGTGQRFHSLQSHIQSEGYSKEAAGAIAASAGRKAHGAHKMAELSAHGRRRHKD